MQKSVLIEVLYIDGCGSAPPTLRRIEGVAAEMSIHIELREVKIGPQADFVKLPLRAGQWLGCRALRSHLHGLRRRLTHIRGIGCALPRDVD